MAGAADEQEPILVRRAWPAASAHVAGSDARGGLSRESRVDPYGAFGDAMDAESLADASQAFLQVR